MVSFMVMLAWMAVGILVSAFWRQPDESRFAWAPIAMFLGPMWVLVAVERHDELDALRRRLK